MRKLNYHLIILLAIILIVTSISANAENNYQITVAEFEVNSSDSNIEGLGGPLADMTITELSQIPEVTVVERSRLEEAMDEYGLQETGMVAEEEAEEIGGLVGADFIVTGVLTDFGIEPRFRLDVRIIDVTEGIVLDAVSVEGEDEAELRGVMLEEVVSEIEYSLLAYDLTGQVVDEQGRAIEGVEISFSDDYGSVVTNQEGQWEKEGLLGEIKISPQKSGWEFSPDEKEVESEVEEIEFVGEEIIVDNLEIDIESDPFYTEQQYSAWAQAYDQFNREISPELRWVFTYEDGTSETLRGPEIEFTPEQTGIVQLEIFADGESFKEKNLEVLLAPAELDVIDLTLEDKTIKEGEEVELTAVALDQYGDVYDTDLSWSTAKELGSFAQRTGRENIFQATKAGTEQIKVQAEGVEEVVEIEILPILRLTEIELADDSFQLDEGEEQTLKATGFDQLGDEIEADLEWEIISGPGKLEKEDETEVIYKAKEDGTAIVQVKGKDTEVSQEIEIEVEPIRYLSSYRLNLSGEQANASFANISHEVPSAKSVLVDKENRQWEVSGGFAYSLGEDLLFSSTAEYGQASWIRENLNPDDESQFSFEEESYAAELGFNFGDNINFDLYRAESTREIAETENEYDKIIQGGKLTAGDYNTDYGIEVEQRLFDASQNPEEEIFKQAIFVEASRGLTDSMRVDVEGRFDNYDKFDSDLSAEAKFTHYLARSFHDHILWYISGGRQYRAPTLEELYAEQKGWGYTGNSQLQPETTIDYEIGGEVSFPFMNLEKLELLWFREQKENMILPFSDDEQLKLENIDGYEISGVELATELSLAPELTADFSAVLQGEDSEETRFISPYELGFNFDYTPETVDITWEGKRLEAPGELDQTEDSSYLLSDLTLSSRLFWDIDVSLEINNLFDEEYEKREGYKKPGRRYNIKFARSF